MAKRKHATKKSLRVGQTVYSVCLSGHYWHREVVKIMIGPESTPVFTNYRNEIIPRSFLLKNIELISDTVFYSKKRAQKLANRLNRMEL